MSSEHVYTMEEFIAYGDRLHYNTAIDIAVNGFAAYIVLKHSTKPMKYYKYYILLTIICAFLMDFHISFIFGPYFMLPAPLFCGAGFVCRHLDHFWGQYIQYGIMHITVSCVGCSVVTGLFYQLYSLNGNVQFFHSKKGIAIILLIMIFYPFPSFAIVIPMQDFDDAAAYIKANFNNSYPLFITASSCQSLKIDTKGVTHFGVLAFQICLVWTVAIIVALKIERKLSEMKNVLSPATLKARRQLLIALCFQLIIPGAIIVFPLVLILISIIAKAQYLKTISDIAMPIIGSHSLFNACSVMYVITPYRTAIINGAKKILRIKESLKTTASENTNSYHAAPQRRLSVGRNGPYVIQ